MRRAPALLVALAVTAAASPGCAGTARDWPLRTTKIQTGAGTLEEVRRELAGTWTLRKFEVLEDHTSRAVRARGELTYDTYGNLTVEGVILDPTYAAASGEQHPLLNYSGRIVIDVDRGELRLEEPRLESGVSDAALEVLAPSNVRRFHFDGKNSLVLVLVPEDGPAIARAEFARAAAAR